MNYLSKLSIVFILLFSVSLFAQDAKSADKNNDGKVFICTMCPDQLSDEAGKCAKCEMDLKEVSVEKATKMAQMKDKKECKGACCGTKTEKAEKVIWNKVCPVRGGEIDTETPTVEYNGKVVGFCCPGCDAKFKADPEKYLKNLSPDGKEFKKN